MAASLSLLSYSIPSVVLDDSDEAGTFMSADLGFRADDPYSVTITLGDDLSWEFARTSLLDGLWSKSGEGRVQVFPDQEAVLLKLDTSVGPFQVDLDRETVEDFLAATYAVVPLGAEGLRIDVDGCIEQIFAAE